MNNITIKSSISFVFLTLTLLIGLLAYQKYQYRANIYQKQGIFSRSDADSGVELIASRNGSKYYFTWCSGVKRIKSSNQIRFDSEKMARAAGYSESRSC